jgi:glycosyltransferase involved in cell wall biosynthesis
MKPAGRPFRVLVVPHLPEYSGAPLIAAHIVKGLTSPEFECFTVFPCGGPLADDLESQGFRVASLGLLPLSFSQAAERGMRWKWLASRVRYARELRRVIRSFQPDVVYVHSAIQLIPGRVARSEKIPLAWHVQETLDFQRLENRFRRWTIRRLADAVIFCGWSPRRSFGHRPAGRLWTVIPNALTREVSDDPDARESIRRELAVPPHHALLIMVGGVHPRKGLDTLLEALIQCRRTGIPDFTLAVAGDPSAAPPEFLRKIEDLLAQEELRDHVRLLGHRQDIPRLLAASDVFVLASRSEGLPLSVVEAFAAGLPAVLTDTGDCARLTGKGRRGHTVPRDDPQAFAHALRNLLQDPESRRQMGARARTLVRKRFSFSRLLEEVGEVLRRTARS